MQARIKEIFESIQGEGLYVGEKEIFVRFQGCNLNCMYCDTDCSIETGFLNLSEEELFDKIKNFDAQTVSLTGGEPLLQSEFIKGFLLKYKKFLNKKIYLETNGTLYQNLAEVIDLIDIVGMDIKIESASFEKNKFKENEKFLKVAGKKAFIKIVFDASIKENEIKEGARLGMKFDLPLILQPKTPMEPNVPYLEIYNKFYDIYKNVRLIPQTHKFIGVE